MAMNLHKTIVDLRRKKGYTQEKLAEMLGVTTAAVSKWETGNSYPDITLLPQLAEIFDVSLDYLFNYDIAEKKTIPEAIKEANRLSKELDRDGSIAIIAKTLARYPNNNQLIFELARHKFINARYKGHDEREILLKEAVLGFETAAKNTENDNRRAWAYHFLTSIAILRNDYDKARSYNAKIMGGKGLYPKVDRAIIEMKQHANKEALHLSKEVMYQSIFEYSLVLHWILEYHIRNNNPDEAIREGKRAINVLREFNDTGLFYKEISVCCEAVACAYATNENYEDCITYLEEAYHYANAYDNQEHGFVYDVYSIIGEEIEAEEKISAKKDLRRVLCSDERKCYHSIRKDECFMNIIHKLSQ